MILFAFNFSRFFFFDQNFDNTSGGRLYFRGHGWAILEVIIIIRFFSFGHQLLGIFLALVLKIAIVGYLDHQVFRADVILRLIFLDGFIIYTFHLVKKNERQLFHGFYKNREGLIKFKELLSEYLPQGIVVLNSDLTKILFGNKCFSNLFDTFERDTEDESHRTLNHRILENNNSPKFMESLIIDKKSIRECGSERYLENFKDIPNLGEVIAKLNKELYLNENAWTLSASYTHLNQNMLFEILLKKIKWDNYDAITVIFNDITFQEHILAFKMADANKDKILATVSHDLRTPLNAIIGILQICEKKVSDLPEVTQYLSFCRDNALLLLNLVNSLLDLQQIGKGKLQVNPERISLRKVLNDVIRLFEFQSTQHSLKLELKVNNDIPTYIETDENRLKQILINLLGNAFKFTVEGSISLEVSQDPEDDKYLLISVNDTGIGIKEEDKDKLFKMFVKLEDKEGVNLNGVGLGLTKANGLSLALSGGSEGQGILLESKYGTGNKFCFKILKKLRQEEPKKDYIEGVNTSGRMLSEPLSNQSYMEEFSSESLKETSPTSKIQHTPEFTSKFFQKQ